MFTYKSKTAQTVSVNRYQVTAEPGVELAEKDEALEALVTSGELSVEVTSDVASVEVPKAMAPVKTGA